jgi:hypothetical protein
MALITAKTSHRKSRGRSSEVASCGHTILAAWIREAPPLGGFSISPPKMLTSAQPMSVAWVETRSSSRGVPFMIRWRRRRWLLYEVVTCFLRRRQRRHSRMILIALTCEGSALMLSNLIGRVLVTCRRRKDYNENGRFCGYGKRETDL